MRIHAATRRGRAAAEALMTLTMAAYAPGRGTGAGGQDVTVYTPKGSTPGKVQASSAQGGDTATRTVRIGNAERPVLVGGLHIPVSAPLPTAGEYGVGWEYEVTAVGAAGDPTLLGRRYLVVGAPAKSFATARRLDVVEVP